MPASTFEAFNRANGYSTPSSEASGMSRSFLAPPKKRDGVRAYQIAPIHSGMCHPPQSEAVRRDLLEYFAANGISRSPVTRLPLRSFSSDLRPAACAARWRPSGLAPVRSSSLMPLGPAAEAPKMPVKTSIIRFKKQVQKRQLPFVV
mmetsp:Transcript_83362/g.131958  ORF Transcript_83362/g.131958 Transcript_83362/m.131958 type:complete len:147 (+) Transcript_83362:100-540(+)